MRSAKGSVRELDIPSANESAPCSAVARHRLAYGLVPPFPMRPLIGLLEFAAGGRGAVPLARFDARRLDWAIATGLGSLVFEAAKDDPESRRSPSWPRVEGARLAARIVTGELLDAARDIVEATARRHLTVTLLKGISVCEQYYPEPHLRLMRDIDLLVSDDALPAAEACLRELGWQPREPRSQAFYATHHHSAPLFHPQRGVWIEVHRGLVPPDSAIAHERVFTGAHIRGEIRPSVFRGQSTTRLSDELQLVYLASHWGRHFRATGGLFAILDAIYLLRTAGERIDWGRILEWLRVSPTAATHLYVLVTYLGRHRIAGVPPEVLHDVRRCQRGFGAMNLRLAHSLVDRYMVNGRRHGRLLSTARVTVLWRTLLSRGSPCQNLARIPGALLRRRRRRLQPS
jgi:hypothetical protein